MKIEICLDSMDSIENIADLNVDRIELCQALDLGGLSPSLGFYLRAKEVFKGEIALMIRPRKGDFIYSDSEIELMKKDIEIFRDYGASSFVLGLHKEDASLDLEKIEYLVGNRGEDFTFHRAIDMSRDLESNIASLVKLNFKRVLTSGGEPNSYLGRENIRLFEEKFGDDIEIMLGGGVNSSNIKEILAYTGVKNFHLSGKKPKSSLMTYRVDNSLGIDKSDEYSRNVTSREEIIKILELIKEG